MKQGIHPDYSRVKVTCSCGAEFTIGSTLNKEFTVDVCSSCHPFYTGKQKQATTGGRIERFTKRFGSRINK
ncbi:large subunit ribosomal protein L31 [Allopseudospirillum japonicum]|uniref:Large ribosomal subunit protein bL31 n=1 Tax=Allopseudospirillum japonicum TaxID=64971 RepID=A0A1H6RI02_9GAMM|nr:50S ribosomal protein L31 [Allopseudospirillum japonicum]SEI51460.1 large subunit ribosomal protein L31 [Allopseudospirillum japonicum]